MKNINAVLILAMLVILFAGSCKKTEVPVITDQVVPVQTIVTQNLPNKPYGGNFGPFLIGPGPEAGEVATVDQVNKLLDILKTYGVTVIRCYTSAPLKDSVESIPSLAKKKGFTVYAGCWLSKDKASNEKEIAYVLGEINKGNADFAIVGSEALLRGDLSSTEIIEYVNQVKKNDKKVKVGVADTHSAIIAHPEIVEATDIILVNIYPYWDGIGIDKAFSAFLESYNKVAASFPAKDGKPTKEIIISETGWPTAGNTIKDAVANQENALKYLEQVLNWSNSKSIKVLYFELFNELWKAKKEDKQGANWGLLTEECVLKPGVLEIFKKTPYYKEPVVVVKMPVAPPTPSPAEQEEAVASKELSLEITGGPNANESGRVHGQVYGVKPSDYGIAVYIKVRGGWWTKPTWADPITDINPDGSWSCSVITGGVDDEFTQVRAYLIKNGYDPPSASGGGLPSVRAKKSASADRSDF